MENLESFYSKKTVEIIANNKGEEWNWLIGKEGYVFRIDENELRVRLLNIPHGMYVHDMVLNLSPNEVKIIE